MLVRFFLIASALAPVCGMCAGSTVPVCWKLPSFSRLPAVGLGWARAGELNASASAETAPKPITLMVSSSRPFAPDADPTISQPEESVVQQTREASEWEQCFARADRWAGNKIL